MEQCRLFKLHVDFPAVVTDCAGNVAKAFNTTLQWDWLRCGCHLIHNVVNAGLESLKNHASNPAQPIAAMVQEVLDRSVLLSFHCIAAHMICLLRQMNMCVMSCNPKWIQHAFFWCSEILQAAWATVPNFGFPHISPCSYILFFRIWFCSGIGLKRLSPM